MEIPAKTRPLQRTDVSTQKLAGLALLAIAASFLAQCGRSEPEASPGERWWRHIEYLASDALEGRETGSEGYRNAALYVADQFQQLGLQEAGTDGYLQSVEFETRRLIEDQSSLELVRDGQTLPIQLGEQAVLSKAGDSGKTVEAEMVFVGYGLTVPEKDYDDFAGLDVKGKIIVTLQGAPEGIPGALASHYQSRDERRKTFERVGALGAAGIQNPRLTEIPWERASKFRFQTSMDLADPALSQEGPSKLGLRINPEYGNWFLEGSGHTFDEILALDKEKKPLPKFALAGKVRGKVVLERSKLTSENVIGILRGADPELRDEYVVLSAHLDHIGVGEPVNGDRINNGAMDDASGVATLLEIGRELSESSEPLRRSVILLACTGEEKGLLGSRYYSERPTVEMGKVVANVNLDMFLPLFPLRIIRGYGVEESDLADRLQTAASQLDIEVQPDPQPERNIFIRSDQYNFIRKGVPALFLGFGTVEGSPEEKIMTEWFSSRYHAPSDDLTQPVDKEAAAKFNRLMTALTQEIANREERPRWREDSFFRRFTPEGR